MNEYYDLQRDANAYKDLIDGDVLRICVVQMVAFFAVTGIGFMICAVIALI